MFEVQTFNRFTLNKSSFQHFKWIFLFRKRPGILPGASASVTVSWRSTLSCGITSWLLVGVPMCVPKHITAVLRVVSLLVEARLNSCWRVLPRAPHPQSGHDVPKHLTLCVCSACLRLANQLKSIGGKNALWTCRSVSTTKCVKSNLRVFDSLLVLHRWGRRSPWGAEGECDLQD